MTRDTETETDDTDSIEQTIEVPLKDFAFWQAQMAHASERATNNPDYNGTAVHRAYKQMLRSIHSFHSEIDHHDDQ